VKKRLITLERLKSLKSKREQLEACAKPFRNTKLSNKLQWNNVIQLEQLAVHGEDARSVYWINLKSE